MAGATQLDESKIKDVSAVARKVGERQDGSAIYQWGPDGKGKNGQIAPNKSAKIARKNRQSANAIKQIMRGQDVSESEAREKAREFTRELQRIDEDEDMTADEKKDQKRRIRRDTFGSP